MFPRSFLELCQNTLCLKLESLASITNYVPVSRSLNGSGPQFIQLTNVDECLMKHRIT